MLPSIVSAFASSGARFKSDASGIGTMVISAAPSRFIALVNGIALYTIACCVSADVQNLV